jgi:putative ABC transport system permease protein
MLRNYLTIAVRMLRRHLGYTAINIVGLAVGMAACLLIGLYVGDELSYDTFHADADRIHVMGVESSYFGRSTGTSYPLALMLKEDLPAVERALRTAPRGETVVRRAGGTAEGAQELLLADASFFKGFSFPLVRGAAASALTAPDAVVITESAARDLFGDADPMGEMLTVELRDSTHTLTVRGVAADVPDNSTIQFDVVAPVGLLEDRWRDPEGWGTRLFHTYVWLSQPLPADTLAAQTKRAAAARLSDTGRKPSEYFSIPLPELYLSDQHTTEGFRGQMRYVYIFGSVALFILLIAAFNYVNLAVVQAQQRAREVGVRKTIGAGRGQLARQFLGESVLVSSAALVVALGVASAALPVFNHSFGTDLALWGGRHGALLAGLAAAVLGVGIAAGGYPAFVLSRFEPVRVLRGASGTTAGGGGWLRRSLVVLQFALSAALIVGTLVVYQQLGYMQTKNLGFDGEQVAVVELPRDDMTAAPTTVKQQLLQHPGIEQVSLSSAAPAHAGTRLGMNVGGVSAEATTDAESTFSWTPISADSAYVKTLGLQVIAGGSFDQHTGATKGVLINEAAARRLGWTSEEAVGKPIRAGSDEGEVIGVVQNFHLESLRQEIEPALITIGDPDESRQAAVKLSADGIQAGMDHVRATLSGLAPGAALEYQFLDDEFEAMYRSEERLSQIFTAFAGLAIFIACLGLLGLAAYAAQRRTKEIGIRKAMGASLAHILGLLSKEFAALVAVALALGMPVAYWGMERWLDDFAYRTEVGVWTLIGAAALALTVAGLTVSYHALRAARTDPATALRQE